MLSTLHLLVDRVLNFREIIVTASVTLHRNSRRRRRHSTWVRGGGAGGWLNVLLVLILEKLSLLRLVTDWIVRGRLGAHKSNYKFN